MRIAICDDRPEERALLAALLGEYLAARGADAAIDQYASGEELLAAFSAGAFSLIFLDIYMDGATGVETARRLKSARNGCAVIFVTTSREHGTDAFDVDTFHYLVKPVEKDRLFKVLDKWYAALCDIKTIAFRCGRTRREVLLRDILYIEVSGRSCTVHTPAQTFEAAMPLSEIASLLPEGEFVRPIRYCLAALRFIASVGRDSLTLTNGETLPVSRKEQETVKNQLAAYRLCQLRRR